MRAQDKARPTAAVIPRPRTRPSDAGVLAPEDKSSTLREYTKAAPIVYFKERRRAETGEKTALQ